MRCSLPRSLTLPHQAMLGCQTRMSQHKCLTSQQNLLLLLCNGKVKLPSWLRCPKCVPPSAVSRAYTCLSRNSPSLAMSWASFLARRCNLSTLTLQVLAVTVQSSIAASCESSLLSAGCPRPITGCSLPSPIQSTVHLSAADCCPCLHLQSEVSQIYLHAHIEPRTSTQLRIST